jgi:rhodanese-related sulfurtransferase
VKSLVLAVALVFGIPVFAGAAEKNDGSPPAIAAWLKVTPAVQILDVRTKEEFATGHLAKAALIPWTDKDFAARAQKELDPAKPVLVYCRSGRRSAEAAAGLSKLGFKHIRALDGGITAWTKAGQPVVKPD